MTTATTTEVSFQPHPDDLPSAAQAETEKTHAEAMAAFMASPGDTAQTAADAAAATEAAKTGEGAATADDPKPATGAATDGTDAEGDEDPADADDADEGDTGEDGAEDGAEKPKNKRGRWQRTAMKLTQKLIDAEERIKQLEGAGGAGKTADPAPTGQDAGKTEGAADKTAGAPAADVALPELPEKPKEEDFEDYAAFLEALSAWSVKKVKHDDAKAAAEADAAKRKDDEAAAKQAEEKERAAAFRTRVEAFKEVAPDFEEAVFTDKFQVLTVIQDAIVVSENGPQLAYYLAKNPAEAQRLNALPPVQALMELGRLETTLKSPPPKRTTNAPEPPPEIGGTGGAPSPSPNRLEGEALIEHLRQQRKGGSKAA